MVEKTTHGEQVTETGSDKRESLKIAKNRLLLTVPGKPVELKKLENDEYGMACLTKNNSDIVEACLEKDPKYHTNKTKEAAMKLKPDIESDDPAVVADAYKEIIKKIATENSTRTSKEAIKYLAEYCAEPSNNFLGRLQEGKPELVDDLCQHLVDKKQRREKSLASKICRYLNEWYCNDQKYTINDSVVRTLLPYYLAYYQIDSKQWKETVKGKERVKQLDQLRYVDFYELFSLVREKTEIDNHQLDHLLWYAYKNDRIRCEVAKALANEL